ncbi:MAG: ornithine cyclodeaminase [Burkholderiales bacterium]|nr:ornithine cyclodeaminase [Burkholderiales bacterium]
MKIVTLDDLAQIVKQHTFDKFVLDLISYLKNDFGNWESFVKMPRPAIHVEGGVIEVMPTANKQYYTFKYVNGHPKNPLNNKLTVVGTGQISHIDNGYPLMFSEMTLLTAFRTAATAALATDLLAKKNSTTMAIIGTGAQSEFQVLSQCLVRNISTLRYFDIDQHAMNKFKQNIANRAPQLELIECNNPQNAIVGADIITVCTAVKGHKKVLESDWIIPGTHINGLGGDGPGKTELDLNILYKSKVVIEFLPQTKIEGEIQQLSDEEINKVVYAELWELVTQKKPSRQNNAEITLFQSVGFAIEDFSALRLVYDLACKYNLGRNLNIIPQLKDPKNLIALLDI